jgi:hypothetical protein
MPHHLSTFAVYRMLAYASTISVRPTIYDNVDEPSRLLSVDEASRLVRVDESRLGSSLYFGLFGEIAENFGDAAA